MKRCPKCDMKYEAKYTKAGFVMGPYSEEELRSKVASGALGLDYLVRPTGKIEWTTIASLLSVPALETQSNASLLGLPYSEPTPPPASSTPQAATPLDTAHQPGANTVEQAVSLPASKDSYGGFWIRLGAYLVDVVVLLIPTLLVRFLYQTATPARTQLEFVIVSLGGVALNILIGWAYTSVALSSDWQATVGKKVCGLKVVDYTGKRISFARASARHFATFLSATLLGIGFIMIAFTGRRQALHDIVAHTLVVREK